MQHNTPVERSHLERPDWNRRIGACKSIERRDEVALVRAVEAERRSPSENCRIEAGYHQAGVRRLVEAIATQDPRAKQRKRRRRRWGV
jgi:hypothetical protein